MRKQSGVEEQGWEGESWVGAEKPAGPLQTLLLITSLALWNCFGESRRLVPLTGRVELWRGTLYLRGCDLSVFLRRNHMHRSLLRTEVASPHAE